MSALAWIIPAIVGGFLAFAFWAEHSFKLEAEKPRDEQDPYVGWRPDNAKEE